MAAAKATKSKQRQQLIRHLKTVDNNWQCFALTKQIIKPHSAGGLTQKTQDDRDTWMAIMDARDMETKLLEHSKTHFSQAHRTAYMTMPLKELLQYNGLMEFGDKVFNGDIPQDLNLPPATWLLLEHQKSLLQPNEDTSHPLTFKGLAAGS